MSRSSRYRDARHAAEYRRAGDLVRHLTAGDPLDARGQAAAADGPDLDVDAPVPFWPVDVDPARAAWAEASERYDELLRQQDADPDAPLGERIKAAYYAQQDAFDAMHEDPQQQADDWRAAQAAADREAGQ